MRRYIEAIEELPNEIKFPLIRVLELFREEIAETVKRSDFEELKSVVKELAEAQKKTEQRLDSLTVKVEELAEAQKKTEQRLDSLTVKVEELAEAQKKTEQRLDSLTVKVEELAEAQKKTEQRLDSLTVKVEELAEAQKKTEQRVEELVEAQKKTEQRVEELAEAQKKTEQRVEELAEAQKKTEEEIKSLARSHRELKEQVGSIAHTVGYRLEDESYKALPALLREDFKVEVKGRLKRDFIDIGNEKYIEVNIWGRAGYNGKEYVIVGEAKSQLKKKDIDDFIKKVEELKKYIPNEQIRLIVTYMASPQVQRYAKEKGVKLYFSYEF